MIEGWIEKVWSVAVIVFGSLVSYFMYHQKKSNDRIGELEEEVSNHKRDIGVIKCNIDSLKSDSEEIKAQNREIIAILLKAKSNDNGK